ncbi:hypothetical protein ACX40Y_15755 [Sphingomonas sp. RS6]
MKLVALALATTIVAMPAAAQSLHETHQRVWMPAGKSHVVTWRMRDRAPTEARHHHQAGKGMMPAKRVEEANKIMDRQTGGAALATGQE